MSGKRYVYASPELISMRSEAAHIVHGLGFATQRFGGDLVTCTGHEVTRNSRDGQQPTVMFRWRINGRTATRQQVYERFGVIRPATAAKETTQ